MVYFEIQLIAVVVVAACAIPGVFLILRQMSMMTDAISHTVLLGIVLAFFITHDLGSPLLIVGAAFMGIFTVYFTEVLNQTKQMSEDSAIGIVFPFLFSIAIVLISMMARNVHLDVRCVLLGELVFAPSYRLVIGGSDLGPRALYTMGTILVINLVFVTLFFKELKLTTFDAGLATALGFAPVFMHYALMTIVSITAVGAFEAVGSVLVIAFMIGPAATAYLLSNDIKKLIVLSILIGALNAIIGFWLAMWIDVSISGMMAVVTGLTFLLVFAFGKENGLVAIARRRKQQEKDFADLTMLFHIFRHEESERAHIENGIATISKHLNWKESKIEARAANLIGKGFLVKENNQLILTEAGRNYTKASFASLIQGK